MIAEIQPDLFANADELPICSPLATNARALDIAGCRWERHELRKFLSFEIGIGRTREGYHSTFGYEYSNGGRTGPVFIQREPYATFREARLAAIEGLLADLETLRSPGIDSGTTVAREQRILTCRVRSIA